jgi:hypothetical protein
VSRERRSDALAVLLSWAGLALLAGVPGAWLGALAGWWWLERWGSPRARRWGLVLGWAAVGLGVWDLLGR